MKYYKIVVDNKIVGAVSSKNFVRFSPAARGYLRADELKGEFANWKGQFYRDTWMKPLSNTVDFIQAHILEITEEEYNAYIQAFETNDAIEYDREEQEPAQDEPYVDPIDEASIDFIRQSKISEMSYKCRQAIENGIDIELRGETQHFSLTTQDQLNLMSLSVMAQTQQMIPYHADGETCIFYTAEEIEQIVSAATTHKVYHTTYYNALKTYINALETIEEIAAIEYGVEIPDEYKSEVLKVIE